MSYSGLSPKANRIRFQPRSSDPINPAEGDVQYADGTVRQAGLWAYKSGTWTQVGSGTGSGGINYILNPDAETNTQGWSTYADAASATPVDGTGGSPNSTWTRSTSSPLRNVASFLFTHNSGASRQGEGASYAFSIDPADQAKTIQISFDYIVASGTFTAGTSSADSDLTVWIYDVTNNTMIQPSSYRLPSNSSSISDKFYATFQTSYNSTSYRLIIHCATTSTSAFTLKFDNVIVGPQDYAFGSPITDWQTFPSVAAGTFIKGSTSNPAYGTVQTNIALYRRVGSNLEIRWDYRQSTGGSAGSGAYLLDISQLGLSIDTTKAKANSGTTLNNEDSMSVGYGSWENGTNSSKGNWSVFNSTQLKLTGIYAGASATRNVWGSSNGVFTDATLEVSANISVPINGWASSVQMSSETTTRIVDFSGYLATNTALTANTTNIPWTSEKDSHGANTSGLYTVAVPGDYLYSVVWIAGGAGTGSVYLNGTLYKKLSAISGTVWSSGHVIIPNLKTGDTLSARSDSSITLTGNASISSASVVSISRISGPSQIAATELIAANYYLSANLAVTADVTRVNYDTRILDTHGIVTVGAGTWQVTIPASGVYEVWIDARTTSGSALFQLYKNGTAIDEVGSCLAGDFTKNSGIIDKYAAGDVLHVRSQTTVTLFGGARTAGKCAFYIKRIG